MKKDKTQMNAAMDIKGKTCQTNNRILGRIDSAREDTYTASQHMPGISQKSTNETQEDLKVMHTTMLSGAARDTFAGKQRIKF